MVVGGGAVRSKRKAEEDVGMFGYRLFVIGYRRAGCKSVFDWNSATRFRFVSVNINPQVQAFCLYSCLWNSNKRVLPFL